MITKTLLLALSAYATGLADCPSTATSGLEAVATMARQGACVQQRLTATNESAAQSLAAADRAAGRDVTAVLTQPSERTSHSVTYRFPERELRPGQSLYFALPPDISGNPVRFVILGHRQDPQRETGFDTTRRWDNVPGLSSVQFHQAGASGPGAWRYWRGQASGTQGAKFAEVRNEVELENLYDWEKYGHAAVGSGEGTTAPLRTDAIRVVSVGQDPVLVSEITVKVRPPSPDRFIEHAFSPNTRFGDPETLNGRQLGGGQGFEGTFPGALALGPRASSPRPELPAGWRIQNGNLHIPLPQGASLGGVEVATGDTRPDRVRNSDGGWGTQGFSRLSIETRRPGGQDQLMRNENVPPEGVLFSSPPDTCRVIGQGEELVISASRDTSYLMGVRIWLNQP